MPANLRYIFNLESQFYFISWVVNLTKKNKISFFEFNRILRRVLLTKVRSQINEAGCFNFKNVLISQGVLHSRKSLVPVHISFRKKITVKVCVEISVVPQTNNHGFFSISRDASIPTEWRCIWRKQSLCQT